jgi:drug/metabolite transporter (DMT)-like permease
MWYYGVILAVVGNLLSSGGQTTQKYSQMKEQQRHGDTPDNKQRVYYKQPYWLLGLVMIIVGSGALDPISLAFTSQSVVSCLCCTALVFNMITAKLLLKEDLNRFHVVSVFLIIIGSILIVLFGNHDDSEYTVSDIFTLAASPSAIVYFVILSIMIIAYLYKIHKYDPSHETFVPNITGTNIPRTEQSNGSSLLILCSFSALLSSISMLSSKIFVELISSAISGQSLQIGYLVIFVIIAAISVFSQLNYYSKAQKVYQALTYVPVFQCFFVIFNVIAGIAFFHEGSSLSYTDIEIFIVGVLLNIIGTYILISIRVDTHAVLKGDGEDANADTDISLNILTDRGLVLRESLLL